MRSFACVRNLKRYGLQSNPKPPETTGNPCEVLVAAERMIMMSREALGLK